MAKVFVYGTLRRRQPLNKQMRGAQYLGIFRIADFDMYSYHGYYPFIVKGRGKIVAELYDVPEDIMPALDRIESGYTRKKVTGKDVKTKETDQGFVYVWNGKKKGHNAVDGGDWVKYVSREGGYPQGAWR